MGKLNVGITGMVGFMGSHLRDRLKQEEDIDVQDFEDIFFDDEKRLEEYVSNCDVIVHLAAMNRGDEDEIYNTNIELVNKFVSALNATGKKPHILFSSSTQIDMDNPYGRSKKEGARILEEWGKGKNAPISILVIPNVFGDSGRPFYNSFVATFCYQITHNEEPDIIRLINDIAPDILFLGMSSPKKDEFVYRWKEKLNVKVIVHCGGMLDVISGETKLYPKWVKNFCLAGIFRFIQEPIRLRRDFINMIKSKLAMRN